MYQETKTYQRLAEHSQRYPLLQPIDLLKFLHQSAFGCGHLVDDPIGATDYIRWEMLQCRALDAPSVEPLDGEFCRVHLSYVKELGISAATVGKLLMLSAQSTHADAQTLRLQLNVAQQMARNGELPFSHAELAQTIEEWEKEDFPACHHSEEFHKAYTPSYRVLKKQYAQWLPMLAELEKQIAVKSPLLIAIEGGSASGKSTFSQLLSQLYDCNVFHMDDYFLRLEQRTPERFAQPGGNIDHERFREQVLQPLSQGKPVQYQRFDCSTFTLLPVEQILPKGLNIIEGAYSMHPELADFYDYSVFLKIAPELQRLRIEKRNSPEMAQRFFDMWIPLEETYFTATDTAARCDMIWEVKE